MINKIKEAVEDMQSKVVFLDGKGEHLYKVKSNGWSLQGVSTVSSIIPKPWLSAWGAKEAVKFLGYSDYEGDTKRAEEVLEIIKSIVPDKEPKEPTKKKPKSIAEKFILFLKEAKGASARKGKTALIDGKRGHEWLEEYVKAKIEGIELPKVPEGNLARPINQFLEWEKENVDYWILSEVLVAYPEKGYAGTLDAMCMLKNGRLALIDFKFAAHISEDYYLQTSGYQATFELYGIKIDDRIIIRFPKTLQREMYNEKEFKYYMVDDNLEVEIIKTDYILDRDTFFHCLHIKKWINQFIKK
jgi:hypothetical protein